MINAIIVDDKQASTQVMKEMLSEFPVINIVACFDRASDAIDYVYSNQVDIALIDAEFPDKKLVESINGKNNKCMVIIISGYTLDFLTRPNYKERINNTLEKMSNKRMPNIGKKINVKCFNSFKISVGNNDVKFRTNKAMELFAFLTHKQGKSVNRSEIIDNLWSEFDGDRALINFNTTLSYVKKALSQYEVDIQIIFERGSYRIDISNIDCDYYTFMDCSLDQKEINEDLIKHYEKTLSLYNGDYLIADDYPWAENRRLFLKNKYIRMFMIVAQYYELRGNFSKVIELLETGFMIAPLDREITYSLIKALLNAGNYSLAVSYYKMHRGALYNELSIEPDVSIKRLMGIA